MVNRFICELSDEEKIMCSVIEATVYEKVAVLFAGIYVGFGCQPDFSCYEKFRDAFFRTFFYTQYHSGDISNHTCGITYFTIFLPNYSLRIAPDA